MVLPLLPFQKEINLSLDLADASPLVQIPDNVKMQQEVVIALMRSSTLFINYLCKCQAPFSLSPFHLFDSACIFSLLGLPIPYPHKLICNMDQSYPLRLPPFCSELTVLTAAGAHDQAVARSGKMTTAADVLKAIQEMDMGPADNLLPILEQELAGEFSSYHIYLA